MSAIDNTKYYKADCGCLIKTKSIPDKRWKIKLLLCCERHKRQEGREFVRCGELKYIILEHAEEISRTEAAIIRLGGK